ncbi:hypothetical protein ACH4NF_01875 [Streptomyces sp. NPDC017248]|uniref:hypothetical protein n=2 Tax=Streptomyces TaxID=1883 RepID=UPI00379F0EA6
MDASSPPGAGLGHVALTVADDGRSATGWVQGLAQFMPDRGALRREPDFTQVRARSEPAEERPFLRDLIPLHDDVHLRFTLRVALPSLRVALAYDADGLNAWIHDPEESWAMLSVIGGGRMIATQGGPRRLADELETAWDTWLDLGSPDLYDSLNLAYCLGLKHVPVVEIFVVAAGFGLRLITGYVSVRLDTSWWPTLGVFLLAIVVVLGKRRSEMELADPSHRPALRGYTKPLVDQLVLLSAGLGVTMLVFFLNTYEPPYGVWAAPILLPLTLLGLFRYLQIVATSGGDADPVRTLVRDRIIVATAVLSLLAWIALQIVVHGTFEGAPDPAAGQGS